MRLSTGVTLIRYPGTGKAQVTSHLHQAWLLLPLTRSPSSWAMAAAAGRGVQRYDPHLELLKPWEAA